MKNLLCKLKNQIVPLLFSIVLTYWTMSSLIGLPIIGSLLSVIAINSAIFLYMLYIKGKGLKGKILFFAVSLVYFAAIFAIALLSKTSAVDYALWILSSRPGNENLSIAFWAITLMVLCYGFSSYVFYFTVVKFRVAVLFMIGIVGFILQSSKVDREISVPFILYIVIFFMLYVDRTKRIIGNEFQQTKRNMYWYGVAATGFVTLTFVISILFPKPTTIPKLAYLDTVLTQTMRTLGAAAGAAQGQNNIFRLFNSSSLKRESSVGAMSVSLSDRVLFEVEADEPLYLRVQSFDKYAYNRWYTGSASLKNGFPIGDFSERQEGLATIISLLEKMKDDPNITKVINFPEKLKSIPQEIKTATIITNDFQMDSFLTPNGLLELNREKNNQRILINEGGSCYIGSNVRLGYSEKYTMKYVSQDISPASREFYYIRKMNKDIAEKVLDPANYMISNDEKLTSFEESVLNASKYQANLAQKNYTESLLTVSDRIYELSNSIIQGKTSDYEKAKAIEAYFHTNDYKYDLRPSEQAFGQDYIEYFLFESKEGICVHFASAMVLMARAAGLPARYVEGFIAEEKDPETGRYVIREKHAHAYPEVYISGFGWMVFEPTVSLEESNRGMFWSNISDNLVKFIKDTYYWVIYLPSWARTLLIPLPFLSLTAALIIARRLTRKIWINGIARTDKKKALPELLLKTDKLLTKVNLGSKKFETPVKYALRVDEVSRIGLCATAEAFNRYKYGGIDPTEKDIKNAISSYKEALGFVRKRVGRLKAWFV